RRAAKPSTAPWLGRRQSHPCILCKSRCPRLLECCNQKAHGGAAHSRAALAAGSCVVGVPWRLVSCIGSAFADATRTERSGCEERTEKKTDRGDGIDRCDRPDRALDRAARF